jgi:D-alanyl-D-alanine carboxypeptidase
MQEEPDNSVRLFSYKDDQPNEGRGVLIPPRFKSRAPVSFAPKSTQVSTGRRGTTRAALSVFALAALVVLGTSGYGYVSEYSQSASPVVTILDAETQGVTTLNYGPAEVLSKKSLFLETRDAFVEEGLSFIEVDLEARQLRYFKKGVLLLSEEIISTSKTGSIYEVSSGLYQIESLSEQEFSSLGQVYLPWLITFQGNYLIHGQPTNLSGEEVATDFDQGGISLTSASAEELFKAVSVNLPILVREAVKKPNESFVYEPVAPEITAKSYLVVDIENDTILAADEINTVLPIASVVKLMTAVVAAEEINLDSRVRVASPNFVTSLIPRLRETSTVSMYSLLQLLLIESSNEAAETIAGEYGREDFIAAMNDKARQLGMLSTNFADPSGLSASNTSTVDDLYKLAKYIAKDRSFIFNITADKSTDNLYVGGDFPDLINFNEVEDMDNFIGGKVGETIAAGQTSVSLHAIKVGGKEREIVIIILGSEGRNSDVEKLISHVESEFNN